MKKEGSITLIELLAIILISCVALMIIVNAILSSKKQKEEQKKEFCSQVCAQMEK